MAQISPDRFKEIFEKANVGVIVQESVVTIAPDKTAHDFLQSGQRHELGLKEVVIDKSTLPLVVGRPIIINNTARRVFSPAIVTLPDRALPHVAQITMFAGETFNPRAGLTSGQRMGASFKAKSRALGFGDDVGSLRKEPGHFGSLLVAASNTRAKSALMAEGDAAAHRILGKENRQGGLPETLLASAGLSQELGLPVTHLVDFSNPNMRVQAFWHPDSMIDEEGVPLRADLAGSTEMLFGAVIDKGGNPLISAANGLARFLATKPGI